MVGTEDLEMENNTESASMPTFDSTAELKKELERVVKSIVEGDDYTVESTDIAIRKLCNLKYLKLRGSLLEAVPLTLPDQFRCLIPTEFQKVVQRPMAGVWRRNNQPISGSKRPTGEGLANSNADITVPSINKRLRGDSSTTIDISNAVDGVGLNALRLELMLKNFSRSSQIQHQGESPLTLTSLLHSHGPEVQFEADQSITSATPRAPQSVATAAGRLPLYLRATAAVPSRSRPPNIHQFRHFTSRHIPSRRRPHSLKQVADILKSSQTPNPKSPSACATGSDSSVFGHLCTPSSPGAIRAPVLTPFAPPPLLNSNSALVSPAASTSTTASSPSCNTVTSPSQVLTDPAFSTPLSNHFRSLAI